MKAKKIFPLTFLGLIFIAVFSMSAITGVTPNNPVGAVFLVSDSIKINYNGKIETTERDFSVYTGDTIILLDGNARISLCDEIKPIKPNEKIYIKSCKSTKNSYLRDFFVSVYMTKGTASSYHVEYKEGISILLPDYGDKILSTAPNLLWIDTNPGVARNYKVVINEIEKSTGEIEKTLCEKQYNSSNRLIKYPCKNDVRNLLSPGKSYSVCVNDICNNFDVLKKEEFNEETLNILGNKAVLTDDNCVNALVRANYLDDKGLNYEAANILLEEYLKNKKSGCLKGIKDKLRAKGIPIDSVDLNAE